MAADPSSNDCGCDSSAAPEQTNRPGLPAINYRLGTHASFMRAMLAQLGLETLPDGANAGRRPLASLTMRGTDDPAIALLDSWATVSDVLTFYQERIANEGYLRTATEQRSVLELARSIGYELNPGVAASTHLAFTVESAVGAPSQVTVPVGTKIQSIPGQGELPQTFETVETIEARAAWNNLIPQQFALPVLDGSTTSAYLAGVQTQVQIADLLLFVPSGASLDSTPDEYDLRTVVSVVLEPQHQRTLITWNEPLDLAAASDAASNPSIFIFRQRAALFGHNAPEWRALGVSVKKAYKPDLSDSVPSTWGTEWPSFTINTVEDKNIDLDTTYPKITPTSWVVLIDGEQQQLYRIEQVETVTRADFLLTSKVTSLTLDHNNNLESFSLRGTTVYVQSELLILAAAPINTPVEGDTIVLDRPIMDLLSGRTLILTGEPVTPLSDDPTAPRKSSEVVVISDASDAVVVDETSTTIKLSTALSRSYLRPTCTLTANVARATHGESTSEILGSGNGSQANQRFRLRKPPLTYVSAPTASGIQSTLTVRVNGVVWNEVPALYGLPPNSQSYMVRTDSSGQPYVVFGDGVMGARLPTGGENVTATYRSGLGLSGLIGADKLSLMLTRPLGIRSVTNPLPTSGAADPETLSEARQNAPTTVLTLDRIVALQDFTDFGRSFTGIGKAQATELWQAGKRLIHITIAAVNGDAVSPSSDVYLNFRAAIDTRRDPIEQIMIESYTPRTFSVAAAVLVDQRYVRDTVLAQVTAALRAAFAFDQRDFGQVVTAAEVISVMQAVPGVIAVDLDLLRLDMRRGSGPFQPPPIVALSAPQGAAAPITEPPPAILPACRARYVDGKLHPAELLLLNPNGVTLKEMLP